MRGTVLLAPDRKRLERDREYDVPAGVAKLLVPRYATYVDGPPADIGGDNDLAKLTVPELKALATDRGVELTATRKDDIVKELEAAMAALVDDDGTADTTSDDGE